MQLKKIGLYGLSAAIFVFSACGTTETAANKPVANNSNTANAAVSNLSNANKTNVVSNSTPNSSDSSNVNKTSNSAATANDSGEADEISGELQVGKTDSVILYFGEESGDYAGYCFPNDSEAGRAILAACKDKQQCEVKGKVDHEAGCQVPGLEADLSASGKILKVDSVKKSGRK
jgi:hypothetical protein